jgi:hypothetical protein
VAAADVLKHEARPLQGAKHLGDGDAWQPAQRGAGTVTAANSTF